MAEYNLSSLGRALSQPQLNLSPEGASEASAPRGAPAHLSRRRKLSSCNSLESLEQLASPTTTEARVLVINTGGTIGMTLHDNGTCGRSNPDVFRERTARCLRAGLGARSAAATCNSKQALAEEHTWVNCDEDGDVTRASMTPVAPGQTLNEWNTTHGGRANSSKCYKTPSFAPSPRYKPVKSVLIMPMTYADGDVAIFVSDNFKK